MSFLKKNPEDSWNVCEKCGLMAAQGEGFNLGRALSSEHRLPSVVALPLHSENGGFESSV